MDDIEDIFDKKRAQVKADPTHRNWTDLLLIALTTGVMGMPPRRSQDWTMMQIQHDNEKQSFNYLHIDGRKVWFEFNVYKTSKHHDGPQRVEAPPQLAKLIRKYLAWLEDNKETHPQVVFLSPNGGRSRFTSSTLTKRLNSLLGDGVSVSALRSIWASEELGDTMAEYASLKRKLEDKAEDMGTSVSMLDQVYVRGKSQKN